MFSPKQKIDLEAELHGLITRYYPDCEPCYLTALFHFLSSACLLFDRYQKLFDRDRPGCSLDESGDVADYSAADLAKGVKSMMSSPHLSQHRPYDPDPRPTQPKNLHRHREPPQPPSV